MLVGAEEAENDGDQLEEVGDDGQPHVAQEVERLTFDRRQLMTVKKWGVRRGIRSVRGQWMVGGDMIHRTCDCWKEGKMVNALGVEGKCPVNDSWKS